MEQNIGHCLFVVMYDFGLHYSDGLKKKKKKRGDVTIYMHFQ